MWSSIFLTGLLASAALADHNLLQKRDHHAAIAAKRADNSTLEKRFSGARFTYFAVGLGACGKYSHPNDFMVALNDKQFGGGYPGPNCFRRIKISYGGKSTFATILDECPGCPYGALDLSEGLFKFFSPLSAGVINGEWSFADGDDGGDDPSPPPPKAPKPDPKPDPKPAPKPDPLPVPIPVPDNNNADSKGQGRGKVHSKTSSKAKPTSTSVSKTKSKSKTSAASKTKLSTSKASATAAVNYHKGNAANLGVPTGGAAGAQYASGGLSSLNQAVIQIGALVVAAGKST